MRRHLARILLLAVACAVSAAARHLPIQLYSTAQGMPRNSAVCMVPDPNGVLWICTSEGLVRFDGSEFRTFRLASGQPSPVVLGLLIAHDGSYWTVNPNGVCHLPAGAKEGDPCRNLAVPELEGEFNSESLIETAGGEIFIATTQALYRADARKGRLDRLASAPAGELFETLGRGPARTILIGTNRGLEVWDGAQLRRLNNPAQPCGFGVFYYQDERLTWATSSCGLYRVTGAAPGDIRIGKVAIDDAGLPQRLVRRRDGSIWFAVNYELFHVAEQPDGSLHVLERFGRAEGVPPQQMLQLVEDDQDNLWGAAEGLGIFRVAASGFQTYYDNEGLGTARISSLFETQAGDLCATISIDPNAPSLSHLRCKNGGHFETIGLRAPGSPFQWGWGDTQFGLQGRDGAWWFPGGSGLVGYGVAARPRDLNGRRPRARLTDAAASPLTQVFRLFEDSRGDLWFSTFEPNRTVRWDRAAAEARPATAAEGWPAAAVATVIREAPTGTMWFGTFYEVVRRRHGRFETVLAPGPKVSFIRDLLVDSAGRLWVTTANTGLYRCDKPEAEHPVFERYTEQEGLSTATTRSLVEDKAGYIYVGTVRGVDRIDPRAPIGTGNIRHYTPADGLPEGEQTVSLRTRDGHLWFGTLHGLAEFDPAQDTARPVPRIYVRRVKVRGEETPLPLAGAANIALDLAADRNQLEIEFAAADLRFASSLRYQYRLDGVDADWSAPSTRTLINYANLPPGERRFSVRAVDADGEVGQSADLVAIDLAAPLWRRWWFLMAAAMLAAGLIYWAYNYRVRNLVAMERLRTRIATDLHDDIGSSLTQISLLSEVGQRQTERNVLGEIAQLSRDLVLEMSDIVWAVSPRHDRFDALAHRMRRFAEDALPDGRMTFDAAGLPGDLSLAIEYRRPLFLAFKEAVNNVSRHSGATEMTVRLAVSGGVFTLEVSDNGCGFDPAAAPSGEGRGSIARRLKALGGSAQWRSAPGRGTVFTATLPLRK